MKKNGHPADGRPPYDIAAVPYRPALGAPPGIEVLTLPRLAERARESGIDPARPSRPAFHQLITVRAGALRCSVDFTAHDMATGDWLWVRPGQVVQFSSTLEESEGAVVVFPAGFISGSTTALLRAMEPHTHGEHITPPERQARYLDRVLDALEDEYASLTDLPLAAHIEAMRHLLSALLIRLAHLDPVMDREAPGNQTFHRFREAVEKDFPRTHRVEDYADRLGYSTRTLTRATRVAVGRGAKEFINDRVLLEAKRLLVHTALSPAAIGERTGFTHPTAFSAFFRQHTGTTPTAFRALTSPRGTSPER
ncbi:helix-turn-helix transcriptional regulator [Streptomyces sp. URMC 127]|uniref:helix-turn-helix transcriptional regulator n=1 Tax=Streptomyces sp. URMC 127 TaxID=3423402 RepID=UPI003F1BFAC7